MSNNSITKRFASEDFVTNITDLKANSLDLNTHAADATNPHRVTKDQVGLSNVANVLQYSTENQPPYPVTSVEGKTGAVILSSETWTFTLENGSTVTKEVVVK